MDFNPYYTDAIWLSLAFISGLFSKKINLPPLIGFLLTGIVINVTGLKGGHLNDVLDALSSLGIMLLLFTIGLKIKIKNLTKKEVMLSASIHMLLSLVGMGGLVLLLSFSGLIYFTDLEWQGALMIGFALSFSSTVFVIKILEDKGELNSFHGKIAIGILVIQDIFAVAFITVSKGELPEWWAILLPVYIWLARKLLFYLLSHSGHGELMTIFGFLATFVFGAMSFSLCGLKPDLGALIMGMILVDHPKSKELYDRMMSYKDFFLVAFFVGIGLKGIPDLPVIFIAIGLLFIIPAKSWLFFNLFSRYQVKPRIAFLSSLSLGNFSEFSLITGVIGYQMGYINEEWLLILAVLMSFSFLIGSPLNSYAHEIFDRFRATILKSAKHAKEPEESTYDMEGFKYVVIGLGSIGKPAYMFLNEQFPGEVIGFDYNHDSVGQINELGGTAHYGDSTSSIFWEDIDYSKVQKVFLAMSDHPTNVNSVKEINKILPDRKFTLGAVCEYGDENSKLSKLQVDFIYEFKSRIGTEFAEDFVKAH